MTVAEMIKPSTRDETARVRRLLTESQTRIAQLRQAVTAAEAGRAEAVRRQALGIGEAPVADAAVKNITDTLARKRQELADAEEAAAALTRELDRLRDVATQEAADALREQVREHAAARMAAAAAVDDACRALLSAWATYRARTDDLARVSPKLKPALDAQDDQVRGALGERTADVLRIPNSTHPFGARYTGRVLTELAGTVEAVLAWHAAERGQW
ncbi:hypothetical protein [Elioraea sp.]|uniref:hypothetical protein n=1 Tax=Elioraea sp. TaxID=2185103 RepID=UPI003F720ADB